MNYKEHREHIEIELEIRRSIYSHIVSDMLIDTDYEDLSTDKKLKLITVMKSFTKLINRYQS